ncbi:MAG: hypothetical protein QNK92_11885 [Amylibacter sp.]
MRPFLILLCSISVLTGCDTPKFGFQYDTVKEMSVDGNKYKVFYNETDAQAVRTNNVSLRSRQAAADGGLQAIILATECKIIRVDPKSDAVLIIARIKC